MSTAEIETPPKPKAVQKIVTNQDSVSIIEIYATDRLVIRPTKETFWSSTAEQFADRWAKGGSLILPHDWTIEIIRVIEKT